MVQKMRDTDTRLAALVEATTIADDETAAWATRAMHAQNDGDDISAKEFFARRDVASTITRKIQALMGDA